MNEKLSYHEVLLALTTIVALADGENHPSEVDARVTMILHEGISNDELEIFQKKYDEAGSLEAAFELALESLAKQPEQRKARAIAWMWQVANVATQREDLEVDLGYIEERWVNNTDYVDLEELSWINKARKLLEIPLDNIKAEFKALPETKKIYDNPH